MAELLAREPLLPKEKLSHGSGKTTSFLPSLARLGLKSLMWAIFLVWVAAIFFFPTELVKSLFSKWTKLTEKTVFGLTGVLSSNCLMFGLRDVRCLTDQVWLQMCRKFLPWFQRPDPCYRSSRIRIHNCLPQRRFQVCVSIVHSI